MRNFYTYNIYILRFTFAFQISMRSHWFSKLEDVPAQGVDEKYSHNLKIESCGNVLRTSGPGSSISSSPQVVLPGVGDRGEGVEETGYIEVCNKGQVV